MSERVRAAPSTGTSPGERRRAREETRRPWALGLLAATPDRAVMVLFWVSLIVSVAVLAGQFRPVVVLPACALVLVATWRLMPRRLAAVRSHGWASLVALALTATWFALNVPYAANYLLVTRDPGFLTLEGFWLTDHASADLPMGSAEALVDSVTGLRADTSAYYPLDGALHAQGAKLLPGLIAMAGWARGDAGVLVGNLAIGSVALLAVYGLARRVVGPWWALLPLVTLGISLPMLAFSRAAYTEPLNVALVFGALTLSWSAFETRSWWRHLLSGALIGATALSRIDGAASVIGFIAGLGLVAGATLLPRHRRRAQIGFLVAGAAALVLVGVGYADLRLLSPGYLADLGDQFSLLAGALAATVAVAVAISFPRAWDPLRRFALRHRRVLAVAGSLAVVLVAVVLTTRFLWLPGERTAVGTAYSDLVMGLQEREGMAVEPARSYDDWSVRWISWYYGWPMVVLSFTGLALLAHRALSRRDPRLIMVLAVIAAPSALYLWQVSISPDQIWAMRRLLPVTLPGFLVASTIVLEALWSARRWWTRAPAVLLGLVVALYPLTTWTELVRVPEQGGRLAEVQGVCAGLPTDKAVYLRAGGPPYLATLRSVCGVEVVQIGIVPTAEKLAQIDRAWGGDVSFVTFYPDALPWPDGVVPAPYRSGEMTTWSYALSYIPFEPEVALSEVWIGTIDEDGTLVAEAPQQG